MKTETSCVNPMGIMNISDTIISFNSLIAGSRSLNRNSVKAMLLFQYHVVAMVQDFGNRIPVLEGCSTVVL